MNETERFLRLVDQAASNPTQPSRSRATVIGLLLGIFALGFVVGALWVHETQIVLPPKTKMFVRP